MLKKDPLQIIPFKTYGTQSHLYLRGRALEDEDIDLEKKGWFNLLINSWKRFETDEIRNSELIISIGDTLKEKVATDSEGYFLLDIKLKDQAVIIDVDGWLDYSVSFMAQDQIRQIHSNNVFKGKMLIPTENASFGIISDIDDTILHTGVSSRLKWKLIVNTFFKTPAKRKALEGSVELYKRLHQGCSKKENNPIFYVSNSPWNLYRYLDYFLRSNDFPHGPLLLRDFRTPFDRTPKTELTHKQQEILNILNTYPDFKFVLIGDCGERDAEIYLSMVKAYPKRVLAIYLRSVDHHQKMKRINKLFAHFKEVPVLIFNNSKEVIDNAQQ